MVRLIDADALLKGTEDHDRISTHVIWNAPTVDAIPVKWLEERYPIHGTYGTEAYFRKAYAIYEVIKEWAERKEE